MVVRRELADHSTELAQAKKSNEELESKLEAAGDSAGSATSTQGGLMDMSAMVQHSLALEEPTDCLLLKVFGRIFLTDRDAINHC